MRSICVYTEETIKGNKPSGELKGTNKAKNISLLAKIDSCDKDLLEFITVFNLFQAKIIMKTKDIIK